MGITNAGGITELQISRLDDLEDTLITSPISGQSLIYNGTNWVNLSAGSVQNAATVSMTNEASDTTCFIAFSTAATGNNALHTSSFITYNALTGSVRIAGTLSAATTNSGPFTATTGNFSGIVSADGRIKSRYQDTDVAASGSIIAGEFPKASIVAYTSCAPATASTNVVAGLVGEIVHYGAEISGNGHNVGVIGIVDHNSNSTVGQMFAVEGRVQATSGANTTTACFVAAAQTSAEGGVGATAIHADYLSNNFNDHAYMTTKYTLLNNDPNKILQTAGIINMPTPTSSFHQVIPRERCAVVTDRFYPPAGTTAVFTSVATTHNTLYAVPWVCPERTTWTKIGCRVDSAIAAMTVTFAIYADNAGVPVQLLLSAGATAAAVQGNAEKTISFSLDPGLYWLAMAMVSGAANNTASWVSVNSWETMGMPTSTTQDGTYFVGTSGAIPNPFGAGAYGGGGFAPLIWLRK